MAEQGFGSVARDIELAFVKRLRDQDLNNVEVPQAGSRARRWPL
jgi:hypothetical protein